MNCMIRFWLTLGHTKSGGTSLEGRDNRRKLLIKKWLYPPPKYGRTFSDNTICDKGRHMNTLTKRKNTVFVRE